MATKTRKNKKTQTLQELMRRPETAKLIREALKSPTGSTSRARAQKLFKIVDKLNNAYDGAGGPGMPVDYMSQYNIQPQEPMQVSPAENAKGMVVFHKIPKPKITYGTRAPQARPKPVSYTKQLAYDGSGGPVIANVPVMNNVQPATGSVPDGAGGWLSSAWDTVVGAVTSLFTDKEVPKPTTTSTTMPTSSGINTTSQSSLSLPKLSYGTGSTTPLTGITIDQINRQAQTYNPPSTVLTQAQKPLSGGINTTPTSIVNPLTGMLNTDNNLSKLTYNQNGPISSIPDQYKGMFAGMTINPNYFDEQPKEGSGILTGVLPSSAKPNPFLIPYTAPPKPAATTPAPGATATGSVQGPQQPPQGSPLFDFSAVDWLKQYAQQNPTQGDATGTQTPSQTFPNIMGGLSGVSGGASQVGSEWGPGALNVQKSLGGLDLSTPLSSVIGTGEGMSAIINGIIASEGKHSLDGTKIMNNPGHIKFNNLPGQIDSGVAATDGGTFASYATPEEGVRAIASIVSNAAAGNSSAYGQAPTLGSFMNTYSGHVPGTGTPSAGNYTQLAEAAVKSGLGEDFFANLMAKEFSGGKSMVEELIGARDALLKQYNVIELQEQLAELKAEHEILPDDLNNYITQHDTYIKETDQEIRDFIDKKRETVDMSDPLELSKMNGQLQYLYTVRGRQNQAYTKYINDSIDQHQGKVDSVQRELDSALRNYQLDADMLLPAIQENRDDLKAGFKSLYNETKNAEALELQTQILRNQAYSSAYGSTEDAIKAMEEQQYTSQIDEIKKSGIILNSDGFVLPGSVIDLGDEILQAMEHSPLILPTNWVKAYVTGVQAYLRAPIDKSPTDGKGITQASKTQLAKEAVEQLIKLSLSEDPRIAPLGPYYAVQMADAAAKQIAADIAITNKVDPFITAISGLNPGNFLFFWNKDTPDETNFVNNVTKLTGDIGDAESARSIYSSFQVYSQDGGTRQGYVNGLLYGTPNPGDGAQKSSNEVIALRIAREIMKGTYDSAVGRLSPELQAAFLNAQNAQKM